MRIKMKRREVEIVNKEEEEEVNYFLSVMN